MTPPDGDAWTTWVLIGTCVLVLLAVLSFLMYCVIRLMRKQNQNAIHEESCHLSSIINGPSNCNAAHNGNDSWLSFKATHIEIEIPEPHLKTDQLSISGHDTSSADANCGIEKSDSEENPKSSIIIGPSDCNAALEKNDQNTSIYIPSTLKPSYETVAANFFQSSTVINRSSMNDVQNIEMLYNDCIEFVAPQSSDSTILSLHLNSYGEDYSTSKKYYCIKNYSDNEFEYPRQNNDKDGIPEFTVPKKLDKEVTSNTKKETLNFLRYIYLISKCVPILRELFEKKFNEYCSTKTSPSEFWQGTKTNGDMIATLYEEKVGKLFTDHKIYTTLKSENLETWDITALNAAVNSVSWMLNKDLRIDDGLQKLRNLRNEFAHGRLFDGTLSIPDDKYTKLKADIFAILKILGFGNFESIEQELQTVGNEKKKNELEEAEKLIKNSQFDDGFKKYASLLESASLTPQFRAAVLTSRGNAYLSNKKKVDFEKAKEDAERAIELDPLKWNGYKVLVESEKLAGRLARVNFIIESVLLLNPGNEKAKEMQLQIETEQAISNSLECSEISASKSVEEVYTEICDVAKGKNAFLREHQFLVNKKEFMKLPKKKKSSTIERLKIMFKTIELAVASFKEKDFNKMLEHMASAIRCNPDIAQIPLFFEKIIKEKNAEDQENLNGSICFAHSNKRLPIYETLVNNGHKIHPDEPYFVFAKTRIAIDRRDFQSADDTVQAFLKDDGDHKFYYLEAVILCERGFEKKAENALQDFCSTMKLDHEKIPELHFRMAYMYMLSKKFEQMNKYFKLGLEKEKQRLPCFSQTVFDKKTILELLCVLNENGRDYEKSVTDLESTFKEVPDFIKEVPYFIKEEEVNMMLKKDGKYFQIINADLFRQHFETFGTRKNETS